MTRTGRGADGVIPDAAEAVGRLTRSRNRMQLLAELRDGEPRHRDALREASDVSRTTLTRNLESLEEQGWIRSDGRTYRITPCGELVAEAVLDLLQTTNVAMTLQDALRWIPVDDLDLDLWHLRDAEVLVPEPGDPYAMVNRHVRTIREMEAARGVLRVTGLHANEAAREAVVDRGGAAELVVTADVAETLTTKPEYASLVEEMRATGRFDVYVVDEEPPFTLAIIDGTVQLLADEGGEPRALVESGSPAVRDWAEDVYADWKLRAEPLEAPPDD